MRPVVLDADEWEHLPDTVYIPVRGATAVEVTVELREMTDARMALLAYSTLQRLVAACGADQPALRLPAEDLPRLRRRLRFHAVLLDVRPPAEILDTSSLAVDRATGEPVVFVPSRPFRRTDPRAQVELQRTADGTLALPTYTSRAALIDGCGPNQYFVTFPVGQLAQVQRQTGAAGVLIDVPLPARLRH
jgi:hypothetical protein